MAQLNLQTTRKLAKLGAYFASVNIDNTCITHSKLKNASQTLEQTEGSLLLPV